MKVFPNSTCVRFVPRTDETDFIEIVSDDIWCYSHVGKRGGKQNLSLSNQCMDQNTILHELMHALGFYHEHNRSDRDNFIVVDFSNLDLHHHGSFKIENKTNSTHYNTMYDYKSIMHYPPEIYGREVIRPKYTGIVIEANGLSETDVWEINKHYSNECFEKKSSDTKSCPSLWISDQNYPHICYHLQIHTNGLTWNDASSFCHRLDSRSTLPIFRDLSEYISYNQIMSKYYNGSCDASAWLGVQYNSMTNNYSWVDSSHMSLSFFEIEVAPQEAYHFYHSVMGSNKWKQTKKTDGVSYSLCQLRLSSRCPNGKNWFYDHGSSICYYYDKNDYQNWTLAQNYCRTVGGSLPFFLTENEFDSFVNLLRTLHVSCNEVMWLGYVGQNSFFRNVNGSSTSFYKWNPRYPRNYPQQSYAYFWWGWTRSAWKNALGQMNFNFLCQYRTHL